MTPLPWLTSFVLATLIPVVTIAPSLGAGGTVLRTALAGVAVIAVMRDHSRLQPSQALLAFTWVTLVAAMTLGSPDLGQGIVRAINWLMFMPLIFLAAHPGHWAIVTRSALFTCWVHLIAVGAQMLGLLGGTWGGLLTSGADYDPSRNNWLTRYTGLLYNPNDLGLILALGVVVALMLASERGGSRAWFAIPSAALFTAGIILTGSRGAVLALVLGIVVLLVFLPTLHRLLVISLAVVTTIALTTREGETRLVLSSITDIFTGADRSASTRQNLWSTYLDRADNLVIGNGFGATVKAGAVDSAAAPSAIATVDNSVLKLLLEGGGLSVAVFLALLAVIYLPLLTLRNGRHRYAAGAILAGVAMIGFRSGSVDLFDINPWNAIIWLFAGLATGLGAQARASAQRAIDAPPPAPRHSGSGSASVQTSSLAVNST
ncbi:MAG: O-antigen ligase family protein [Ornithinimicrobium sp.]